MIDRKAKFLFFFLFDKKLIGVKYKFEQETKEAEEKWQQGY